MDIQVEDLPSNIRCLRLSPGRLDIKTSSEIEMRFTALASTDATPVAVDLSQVDFLASIGMRLLLSCAKAKMGRGGRLVLFGMPPLVLEALQTAGIDTLVPCCPDLASAQAALLE